MVRVFRYVDISGCELHTIYDPEDQLPIPVDKQEVSIGSSRMRVESVTNVGSSANPRAPSVCYVRVRTSAPSN